MKCTICSHPKRKEIDKSLVSGTASIRAIASQWQVGRDALRRHVNSGHIIAKVAKSAAAKEAVEAEDFLTYLQKRRSRFQEMAIEAKKGDNPYLELKVYQVESKFAEMEGKALGAFRDKVEHTGNVELQVNAMSDEEVERRARQILQRK